MIRFFDFVFSLVGIFILSPLFCLILILGFFDTQSPLFKQKRVGKNTKTFTLFKFRTMRVGTISRPTHESNPDQITKLGRFLRSKKIDELPQLFNVLIGNMSIVGPRPCLKSQQELISEREKRGVYELLPGITGLSQINKIDMSNPKLLAESDAKLVRNFTIFNYFKIILLTIFGKGQGDVLRKDHE